MTPDQAAALRAPFPTEAIGKKPQPYKKDSVKSNCNVCGGYHGQPATHLDYVGHAAATARLLDVDPEWTWRPFTAEEIMNLPPSMREGGLWIMLTVAGVTRPGFGDGPSIKECIGDALRNAAMRFGVALDLWSKEDIRSVEEAQGTDEATTHQRAIDAAQADVGNAWAATRGVWDLHAANEAFLAWNARGIKITDADEVSLYAFASHLRESVSPPTVEGSTIPTEDPPDYTDPWANMPAAGVGARA